MLRRPVSFKARCVQLWIRRNIDSTLTDLRIFNLRAAQSILDVKPNVFNHFNIVNIIAYASQHVF